MLHLNKALFDPGTLTIIVVLPIAAAMPVTLLLPDTKQFDALLALGTILRAINNIGAVGLSTLLQREEVRLPQTQ